MTDFIPPAQQFALIHDVYTVPIRAFADERGRFMETFRREWFPSVLWDKIQTNRSESKARVLRGLHYHLHQIDYWYVLHGRIRVGLADLRPASPTFLQTAILHMGEDDNIGLFIPIGVAHGFVALTDCILTYMVNNYYDGGADERGVAWDDPDLGVDWAIDFTPVLSPRDAQNRRWADIPLDERPK